MFIKRAKARAKKEELEREREEEDDLIAFEDANSNEELQRYPQMLVIDLDGKNLGVITFEEAWEIAQQKDSDLLLVKEAEIPVVRVVPPRAMRNYQRQMKAKEKKKAVVKIKELRFRDVITEHDLGTKVRSALGFFKKGHKVKLQLGFKRRIDFDPEPAIAIMQNICDRLTEHAIIDGDIKFSNSRYATQMMSPKGGKGAKNARTEVGAPKEEIDKARKEAQALREGKSADEIDDEPEFLDLKDDEKNEEVEEEDEERAPPVPEYKSLQDQLQEQFMQRRANRNSPLPASTPPPTRAAPQKKGKWSSQSRSR